MNEQTARLSPTWEPWTQKIHFHCPFCDKKMATTDPLLPLSASCLQCHQELYLEKANYPIWKISGFILLVLVCSRFDFGRIIVITIISMAICLPIFKNSKRRLKLKPLQFIAGSLTSTGWIPALILGVLYFTVDAKVKKIIEEDRIKAQKEMFREYIER